MSSPINCVQYGSRLISMIHRHRARAFTSQTSSLRVLGIETSCDDTGVAIVDDQRRILANCLHSQLPTHVRNGGIIPVVAKDLHLDHIDRMCHQALDEASLSFERDIDAVAVTNRPGLTLSLQVGLNYAKKLAQKYSKPLIPIHHMRAHALIPLLSSDSTSSYDCSFEKYLEQSEAKASNPIDRPPSSPPCSKIHQDHNIRPQYPFLVLLMSGGHCLIAVAHRHDHFSLLGSSIDDAPGDLLDKAARRLRLAQLGPPFDRLSGGASIEMLARQPGADRFALFNSQAHVPMIRKTDCDFSFSGYRPFIDTSAKDLEPLWLNGDRTELIRRLGNLCASLQRIIIIQIVKKLQRALLFSRRFLSPVDNQSGHGSLDYRDSYHEKPNDRPLDLVISGGVACNRYFVWAIRHFCHNEWSPEMRVFVPPKSLCSDNGLMIAWNGMLRLIDHRRFLGDHHLHNCLGPTSDIHDKHDLNNQVLESIDQFERLDIATESPLGVDLRSDITRALINSVRISSSEFKLGSR